MPNRYVCSVLEEIRECHKTRNYSYLLGLVEEVQTLVNRMEAALGDKRDCSYYREQRSQLRDDIRKLEKKKAKLEKKCGQKPSKSASQRRYL